MQASNRPNAAAAATAPPTTIEGSTAPAVARRVVGYFPIWMPNSGYTAANVDFSAITTIAHFAVVPHGDGSIGIPDWGPFPDPALMNRAHAAGVKVVLVVGGDDPAAAAGFSAMAADPTTRQTGVRNLMTLVNASGYDGIDIDWEFPSTANDRANLTVMVADLRAALGPNRMLSLAAPATDWWGQWIDIPAVLPNVDWIGAMTYALSGPSWSDHVDNSSALYSSRNGEASVDATRTYYQSRGVPSGKLLIGLPFYGERFDDATALHQPLTGKGGGAITYPDAAKLIGKGWNLQRDSVAQVPYLVHSTGSGIISYEDATSIAAKCAYVVSNNLGGAIIWHLGQDWTGGSQPLLTAAAACR